MAMRVQSLTVKVEFSNLEDVGVWIDQFPDLERKYILDNLHDPEEGPSVIACQLATNALVGLRHATTDRPCSGSRRLFKIYFLSRSGKLVNPNSNILQN